MKKLFYTQFRYNFLMQVKIYIDGERIGLNEFVEKFFGSTINGAIDSLSGVKENWEKVEIRIDR